jgi:3-hydroxybutyryl-CoA dehydrogenase
VSATTEEARRDPSGMIGVVGAGTMGSGIAQVFAAAGFAVHLHDPSPAALERALMTMERSLGKFVEKKLVSASDRDATLSRVKTVAALDQLACASFIVEAAVESLEVKRAIFQQLDAIAAPEAILSSNTSSLSITALGAATSRADRVLGMHFMNPVPMMPLVELVRGQATSDATMQRALDVCGRLGKTAVEAADYPGFIATRVLMPMINEAMFAVMEGVGTPEAVDAVMKLGMNHPMGPLALADFIGLDVCLAILRVLQDGFGDPKYRPCPLLVRMVDAGQLGRKSGRGFYDYNASVPAEPKARA